MLSFLSKMNVEICEACKRRGYVAWLSGIYDMCTQSIEKIALNAAHQHYSILLVVHSMIYLSANSELVNMYLFRRTCVITEYSIEL